MRIVRSFGLAVGALLLLAPAVLGDECCGDHQGVVARPSRASPGEVVTFDHLDCTGLGEPAPKISTLSRWHLDVNSILDRDAEDPPLDSGTWAQFKEIVAPDSASPSALIIVPDLPAAGYHLWWTCDLGGGGVAFHDSAEPVLAIVGTPASDTAPETWAASPSPPVPAMPAIVGGVAALLVVGALLRRLGGRSAGRRDAAGR